GRDVRRRRRARRPARAAARGRRPAHRPPRRRRPPRRADRLPVGAAPGGQPEPGATAAEAAAPAAAEATAPASEGRSVMALPTEAEADRLMGEAARRMAPLLARALARIEARDPDQDLRRAS